MVPGELAHGSNKHVNKHSTSCIYSESNKLNLYRPDMNEEVPHVFISYQWGSQETMLRVRDRLKEQGYNVWMDVKHHVGAQLQRSTRAKLSS